MARLSISRAWDETRAVLARDGKLIATVALALLFLPGVVADVVAPAKDDGGLPSVSPWSLLFVAAMIIGLVGQIAIIRLSLGARLSVGEAISDGARRMPPYLVATLIWLGPLLAASYLAARPMMENPEQAPPAAALALLVLMIAMIFIAVRMLMTTPVASSENLSPLAILRRSWALTRGHWWRLFGFFLLYILAVLIVLGAVGEIAGLIAELALGDIEPMSLAALLVAIFTQGATAVASTVFAVMLARIYVQLASPPATVPTSGT